MEFFNSNSNSAIYLQITDVICENVLTQRWRPDDRVPSVREMAISLEVNPNTVLRAYTWLQDQGIIHNRRGIGYFVSERAPELARNMSRNELEKKILPSLFKKLASLEITVSELGALYKEYLKENKE